MKLKIMYNGKKVGETSLIGQENNYSVVGELFEYPRLQCEKTFKSKIEAVWNLFWLNIELKNTYRKQEI